MQVAYSSKYLISPIIAGFLISATNIEFILTVDICTFFVTVFTVLFVKQNMETKKVNNMEINFSKELKEGWKAITGTKGILILVFLISAVTLFMGLLQTLVTPMVLPFTDSKTLGIMESIGASGMLVSSLIIGIAGEKISPRNMLIIGVGLTGVFISLTGVSTNIIIITIFIFLFFSSLPLANTGADVLVRKNIPNEIQGRAWALIGLISQMGFVVAYALGGILADYIFNPLLIEGGALSSSVGKLIGVGEGRGIGLLFILAGIFVVILAVIIGRNKSISSLDKSIIRENEKFV